MDDSFFVLESIIIPLNAKFTGKVSCSLSYTCKSFCLAKCYNFEVSNLNMKKIRYRRLCCVLNLFANLNYTHVHVSTSDHSRKKLLIPMLIWARSCHVSYAICEQQRCRSACASAQSDQHLCCSLLRSMICILAISKVS